MHGMNNLKFKLTALRGVRYSDVQMESRMYVHLMNAGVTSVNKNACEGNLVETPKTSLVKLLCHFRTKILKLWQRTE